MRRHKNTLPDKDKIKEVWPGIEFELPEDLNVNRSKKRPRDRNTSK